MTVPRVSIVAAVRNAEEHLSAAGERWLRMLRSGVCELILVDDASTDSTPQLLRGLELRDPAITVLRLPMQEGPAVARSRGIERARGEYVWQCDVDDEWDESIVEVMLGEAERSGADLVICRAQRVEISGRRWVMEGSSRRRQWERDRASRAMLTGQVRGYLWNKLFRRSLLPTPSRERLSSQDDFLVVLDAVGLAHRVVLLPDILYTYREGEHTLSSSAALALRNVGVCEQRGREVLGPTVGSRWRRRWLEDYFSLWFFVVPVATTPVHQGWPTPEVRAAHGVAVARASWRGIVAAMVIRPRLAVHAVAVLAGPRLYPGLYRVARGLIDRTGSR